MVSSTSGVILSAKEEPKGSDGAKTPEQKQAINRSDQKHASDIASDGSFLEVDEIREKFIEFEENIILSMYYDYDNTLIKFETLRPFLPSSIFSKVVETSLG